MEGAEGRGHPDRSVVEEEGGGHVLALGPVSPRVGAEHVKGRGQHIRREAVRGHHRGAAPGGAGLARTGIEDVAAPFGGAAAGQRGVTQREGEAGAAAVPGIGHGGLHGPAPGQQLAAEIQQARRRARRLAHAVQRVALEEAALLHARRRVGQAGGARDRIKVQ